MLINLRNALMAGTRLPYDAEVEYLESTGTQYILLPANNYDGVDIMLEPASGSTYGNIGRRTGTRADSICFDTTMGWAFRAYSSLTKTNDTNRSLRHATVHGTTATLDGVSYTLANGWNTVAFANKPFALFGLFNPSTQVMFAYVSCKIGACALYVGSEKVYDFIPVRKGTVGYLYDRVSGKLFGNAGTGDFVLGPDVVPVEYIESHGTEWIDTGVIGTDVGTLEMRLKKTDANGTRRFILNTAVNPQPVGSSVYFDVNTSGYFGQASNGYECIVGQWYDIEIVRGVGYYFDGTLRISTSIVFPFRSANNLLLFWVSTNNKFIGQTSALKIYDNNNILARSFYPVRVGTGSTWNGAMIDTLTRRIYRNQGTGAFGYGNDLKYPIPAE